MPRFSANLSLLFTELPLLERFQAARDHGFEAVEIQFPYETEASALNAAIRNAGVELILINVPAGDLMSGGEGLAAPPQKREEFIRAVDQTMEYAHLLRPQCVNVLPGRSLNTQNQAAYRENLAGNLGYTAEQFADEKIRVVFEAVNTYDMPHFLVSHPDQVLRLLADIDHPNLYMQYDIYHMQRMGVDHAGFIGANASRIGHFQFADAPGRHEPGTGEIDFGEIFSTIEQSAYSGFLGAEYHPSTSTAESLGWMQALGG